MAVKLCIFEDLVNEMDMSHLLPFIEWNVNSKKYFDMEAGKEHYKLVAYLSNLFDNKYFVNIGTHFGFSALALAHDDEARVKSYDVFDHIPDDHTKKENIQFEIMDYINDMDEIVKSDFIIVDTLPHDGIEEKRVLDALKKKAYTGVVLFDNINLTEEMKTFWNEIEYKKHDLTKYGHWSGTGLVIFDESRFELEDDDKI
jgi:hypothetical protein